MIKYHPAYCISELGGPHWARTSDPHVVDVVL